VGHIARLQRIADNDANFVDPQYMLAELLDDNGQSAASLCACAPARGACRLRRTWRHRHGEFAGKLDRRDRKPRVVSF